MRGRCGRIRAREMDGRIYYRRSPKVWLPVGKLTWSQLPLSLKPRFLERIATRLRLKPTRRSTAKSRNEWRGVVSPRVARIDRQALIFLSDASATILTHSLEHSFA